MNWKYSQVYLPKTRIKNIQMWGASVICDISIREGIISQKHEIKILANDFTFRVFSRGPKNSADVMISDSYEVDILTDLWSPVYIFSACTIEKKPLGDGVMPGAPPSGENQTRVERKSTRLNSVTWNDIVCRLLLEKKKGQTKGRERRENRRGKEKNTDNQK